MTWITNSLPARILVILQLQSYSGLYRECYKARDVWAGVDVLLSYPQIHMKTMPTSIFRLLTGQDTPHYI